MNRERNKQVVIDAWKAFASVIDSGLFHVLPDNHRQRSVEGLVTVLEPVARTQLATTFKNCCEKVEQAATTYM